MEPCQSQFITLETGIPLNTQENVYEEALKEIKSICLVGEKQTNITSKPRTIDNLR